MTGQSRHPSHPDEPRLPAGPLREYLDSQGITSVPGIQDRRLYGIRSGADPTVTLDMADRIFVALGRPWLLHELYPLEEEAA